MNRDDLFKAMVDACTEILGVSEDAVTPDAVLREDLNADSLDLAELAMAMEDRVGVSVPDQAFKRVTTVSETLDLIEQHLTPAQS
ncbi:MULTISPECIES: acyl carrier protein [Streptomyces]|uniref:Acyl carrier protein n=1 Tax=Streptomyces cacaoi TaxID=1898 RepID=A0A4Y3QWG7_STRCI|nr:MULTISPECIES: acyl carrier protein [Streptomyces]NNG87331.1 acyl carrier protein [Streptomyces cacaoi]QHF97379.1 acyl carrier protein [Streptomyces sp. NHF165]GEB48923.1 acyl carrier protein [Streptomyces cacaoi]